MNIKYFFKALTLVLLLQVSSTIFSIDIFGEQGFQGLINRYKAGDLEVLPALLKHMDDVKEVLPKHVILNFLDIKYGENTRDEAFAKAQNDLKQKYLKYSLEKNAPMPIGLSSLVFGYLKKYKLVKTLNESGFVTMLKKLDNDRLAVALQSGKVQIWDLKTYQLITTLMIGHHSYTPLQLLNLSGDRLAVVYGGTQIQIWNLKTYQLIKTLQAESGEITSLLNFNNDRLVAGYSDGFVRIWDLNTYQYIKGIAVGGRISSLLNLSGDRLAIGLGSGEMQIWNLKTYQHIKSIQTGLSVITSLLNIDDNRIILKLNLELDLKIEVWDLKKSQRVATIADYRNDILNRHLAKFDDNRLAVSELNEVKIWDLNTYKLIDVIKIKPQNPQEVGINAVENLGGRRLAVGVYPEGIQIWDEEELDIDYSPSNSLIDKLNIDNHNEKLKKESDKAGVELSAKPKQPENSNTIFRFLANLFGSEAPPKLTIAG